MRYLDTTYKVNRQGKAVDYLMRAHPGGQVPVELKQGQPGLVNLNCSDNIEAAVEDLFRVTVNEGLAPVESIHLFLDNRPTWSAPFSYLKGVEWIESYKVRKGAKLRANRTYSEDSKNISEITIR